MFLKNANENFVNSSNITRKKTSRRSVVPVSIQPKKRTSPEV